MLNIYVLQQHSEEIDDVWRYSQYGNQLVMGGSNIRLGQFQDNIAAECI